MIFERKVSALNYFSISDCDSKYNNTPLPNLVKIAKRDDGLERQLG